MSGHVVTAVDYDYDGMATAGSRVRQMTHLVCLPGPTTQPTPDWALLTVRDAGPTASHPRAPGFRHRPMRATIDSR
jgi:hypothetical protein